MRIDHPNTEFHETQLDFRENTDLKNNLLRNMVGKFVFIYITYILFIYIGQS